MTKTEEFLALCPQPKASPVSCSGPLRATVATGVAAGRYIKGDVLTVAVWDRAKSPLVVWYFYGEEWTVPFPVSWTVKMKKKQKETQDILSYHTQAAGCSDKARAKASGGRQPIEECGRTGL